MSRSERTNAMSRMSRAGLSLSLRTSLYQTNSSNGSLRELGVVGRAAEERCCLCSGDGSALPLSYNTTAAVAAATRANSSVLHWVEWVSRYGTLRCKSAAGNTGHYHDRGHGAGAGGQGCFLMVAAAVAAASTEGNGLGRRPRIVSFRCNGLGRRPGAWLGETAWSV